jgi:hypothetical protein
MFYRRAAERHIYGPIDIWIRVSACVPRILGETSQVHLKRVTQRPPPRKWRFLHARRLSNQSVEEHPQQKLNLVLGKRLWIQQALDQQRIGERTQRNGSRIAGNRQITSQNTDQRFQELPSRSAQFSITFDKPASRLGMPNREQFEFQQQQHPVTVASEAGRNTRVMSAGALEVSGGAPGELEWPVPSQ